jgi:hypothetical protein
MSISRQQDNCICSLHLTAEDDNTKYFQPRWMLSLLVIDLQIKQPVLEDAHKPFIIFYKSRLFVIHFMSNFFSGCNLRSFVMKFNNCQKIKPRLSHVTYKKAFLYRRLYLRVAENANLITVTSEMIVTNQITRLLK